jgi:hypothetical protein
MKKTTLTFPSLYIRLILLSLFITIIVTETNAKNESFNIILHDSVSIESISQYRIYSKENSPVQFADSNNYLIVLKNNRNCLNCFEQFNEFARVNKNNLNALFIVISQIDSATLERKRSFFENKKLMPDFDDYLFQYRSNLLTTIFDDLHTNYTPELIIISHGKISLIPYTRIFDYPSLNISIQTQFKISELLK